MERPTYGYGGEDGQAAVPLEPRPEWLFDQRLLVISAAECVGINAKVVRIRFQGRQC